MVFICTFFIFSEYWSRGGDNVTIVTVDGSLQRNAGVRTSTRSLQHERGKLTRQDSVRSVDRIVRNGSLKGKKAEVLTEESSQQQDQQVGYSFSIS